ncbi:adenosine-deaminase (editase) domain-containing protein [Sarocladium implicatum]|nr:adenosine-deaminase (editase) domain-containing protein [Sarocladium implicatum]
MCELANAVASAVLTQFAKLPTKRKPAVRGNGLHEWVPLSGIVAEKDGKFTCIALATGMKCLPAAKLKQSNGVGIHDWHAEVLAMRAFNRFLLDESCRMLDDGHTSEVLQHNSSSGLPKPFAVRDDVKLHMYCSEAPCGDASMELTMAAQDDGTPWAEEGPQVSASEDAGLPGRGYFSKLGIVRRKPARGDAPPTMSKSCSDKLAAAQCLSLLSSITALFIEPSKAYIDTLVLPKGRYSAAGCARSFSAEGRMKPLSGMSWDDSYRFAPFEVATTTLEFEYSKTSVQARSKKVSASNLAAAWTISGLEETILGGVVQGRKAFDVKGASRLSRRGMWVEALKVEASLGHTTLLGVAAYGDIKALPAVGMRAVVKAEVRSRALSGWIQNQGDDDFRLD